MLTSICNLLKDDEKTNFFVHYWALKTIGDIAMHFKDLKESTQAFVKAKHLCEFFDKLEHKMIIYKQLGYLYRIQKEHMKAASCFKKMLQLAWFNGDQKSELEAYDNIGCEYFYIGNLKKAKFYNDKVCFGDIEMPGSIMRKVAVQILETRL